MSPDLDQLLTGNFPRVALHPDKGDTVRFVEGAACCTSAYNYKMSLAGKMALARRVVAALNATAKMSLREIEDLAKQ